MSQRSLTIAETKSLLACLPLGVGHDREGVCLLVKIGPYRILLDCGLENIQPLLSGKEPPADLVFCSHAHGDHARGLLALHEAYPGLPIYASEVTVRLLPLNWPGGSGTADFCQGWPWGVSIPLLENLEAEIFPAGHLPGAAVVVFTYKTPKRSYKVMYTGDFSLSNFQLVEGLPIDLLRGSNPDVLIIEGSCGTERHPHRRQQEKHLMERIHLALEKGQNVLLPVPVLGLGQEILKLLRSHHQFTGRDLDLWVGGKIAAACDIYLELLPRFPVSVQNFAKHQPLFWDDRICPRLRRLTTETLDEIGTGPAIVLTDRLDNLSRYLERGESWLLLIPEHFQEWFSATPGFKIFQKSRFLTTETYLLSEHSDSRNTTQLIHNIKPQHILFVHGSPPYLADLTGLEELQNRYQLHSPAVGTLVELPLGDRFIQPNPPAPTHYEGELNESKTAVTISLPETITRDPRWSHFADTGLVEARWQGEDLLLRGLSQRELLKDTADRFAAGGDSERCRVCEHYKGQRCWNPQSPLYGFKVLQDGYCPVFECRAVTGEI